MTLPGSLGTGPVLLRPDNFVPFARTPWGGTVIGSRYKQALVKGVAGVRIGESWEFSCDPALPSKLVTPEGGVEDLAALISAYPEAVLSPARVRRGEASVDLMVKLLDTAEPLSLQVHPRDGDPSLGPGESGKPESWLVLAAQPGAGIYLGFSRELSRAELERAIRQGGKVEDLLHFVPVAPGDYFEIEPGVPHLIGKGVTLLEPQRVISGKAGKTLRLWDWNRRYDPSGQSDPQGQPRELHLDACWSLIDLPRQVGPAFVETLRRTPQVDTKGGVEFRRYPANQYYQVTVIKLGPGADVTISVEDGYAALIMLGGAATTRSQRLIQGQPALLPHAAMPINLKSASQTSEFAVITPAGSSLSH